MTAYHLISSEAKDENKMDVDDDDLTSDEEEKTMRAINGLEATMIDKKSELEFERLILMNEINVVKRRVLGQDSVCD